MIKLAMLDRDGVLNAQRVDFVKSPDEWQALAGAADAVARLNRAGIKVAIVTNQSCVGRGIVSAEMLQRIHHKMRAHLAQVGASVDEILVCTDPPWAAGERRKPAPGMLREAMRRFAVAPPQAVMIGDDLRDLQAAAAAGCARILVRTGKGAQTQGAGLPSEVLPVGVCADLAEAVERLVGAEAAA